MNSSKVSVNLNNFDGMVLDGASYLSYQSEEHYDEFSILAYIYRADNDSGNGIIYTNPFFSLGLKSNKAYVTSKHGIRISNIEIPKNKLISIAVVCSSANKGFYLTVNGMKFDSDGNDVENIIASDETVQSSTIIGKGICGGIISLQLYAYCLKDDQILNSAFKLHSFYENACLNLTFAHREIKDISSRHVQLINHNGVYASNLVPTTEMSAKGYFQKTTQTRDEYTLCTQIYPLPSRQKSSCIFQFSFYHIIALELLYEKCDDGNYHIVCRENGKEAISNKILSSRAWYNIVLVWSGDKIQLYIDGVLDLTTQITLPPEILLLCIGGTKDNTSLLYGYINYVAEYKKAFTSQDVLELYDFEPFIFDDKVMSVINFRQYPKNLVPKSHPIQEKGVCRQGIYPDTNPLNPPTGTKHRLQRKPRPEFKELPGGVQIQYKTIFQIIQTINKEVFGITKSSDFNSKEETFIDVAAVFNILEDLYHDLFVYIKPDTIPIPTQPAEFIKIFIEIAKAAPSVTADICGPAAVGAVSESLIDIFTVAALAINTATFALVVARLIVKITDIINNHNHNEEEEHEDEEIRFEAIKTNWHHNNDAKKGSLHYHYRGLTKPDTIDFKFEIGKTASIVGLFVLSEIGDKINLNISIKSLCNKSATIKLVLYNTDTLSEECALTETFQAQETKTLKMHISKDFSKVLLAKLPQKKYQLYIQNRHASQHLGYINSTFYVIAKLPAAPWRINTEPYNNNQKDYVNLDFLDMLIKNKKSLNDKSDLDQALFENTQKCIPSSSNIVSKDGELFDLNKFVYGGNSSIDSFEFAAMASLYFAVTGTPMCFGAFIDYKTQLKTNLRIDAGSSDSTDTVVDRIGFIMKPGDDPITKEEKISCHSSKIDMGLYPSHTDSKDFKLAIDMQLAEYAGSVNRKEPYSGMFFKERMFVQGFDKTFEWKHYRITRLY